MARCPTCGGDLAANADVCPDCGMDLLSIPPGERVAAGPAVALTQDEAANVVEPPDVSSPPIIEGDIVAESDAAGGDQEIGLEAAPAAAVSETASGSTGTQAPQAAGSASITLKRGGLLTTERFVFGKSAVVGRFDPSSGPVDVDLAPLPEASYVSRHHAHIHRDDSGQWLIKDNGSRNGTFVRGPDEDQFTRVVDDHPLTDGDEIAFGNARFEFQSVP